MKNKGMIAALGLILVLGIVTTAATRRYIREQAGSERSLTVGPEAMYEAEPFAAEAAESFPICGMDDTTLEYLIANLAFGLGKYDIASKLISEILIRPYANSRMKEKTRELKDAILAELRKNKA